MVKTRVYRSKNFKSWHRHLNLKDQGIVDTRIDAYIKHGYLNKAKSLDPDFGLFEFKWDSGLRVYFSLIEDKDGRLILLLIGGNKNSQTKDIADARNVVLKAVTKITEKEGKNERS